MAGAADRCVIPEVDFDIDQLAELLIYDRNRRSSRYSVVLISEGAKIRGDASMSYMGTEKDQYGHAKLGGIGARVGAALKHLSPKYNKGKRINVVNQRLGYLVRCGAPDALDCIVPMAFGNLALDLILEGVSGQLINIHDGIYGSTDLECINAPHKVLDVDRFYNKDRLRPSYLSFDNVPLFVMTAD